MKGTVVWTRQARTGLVSTYKESERVISSLPCLHSVPCHLGHGRGECGVGGRWQLEGEESYLLSCSNKEAGAAELFQGVGMETG